MAYLTKEEFLTKYGKAVELEFDHYYKFSFYFSTFVDVEGRRVKIVATEDDGNANDIYKKKVESNSTLPLALCTRGTAYDDQGKEIDHFLE